MKWKKYLVFTGFCDNYKCQEEHEIFRMRIGSEDKNELFIQLIQATAIAGTKPEPRHTKRGKKL